MSDHRLVFALALLLALGCGSKKDDPPAAAGQSFREGMAIICKAGQQGELKNVNPAERAMKTADWIRERLRNPEAIALFGTIAEASPAERAAVVDDAVRRAGLEDCPTFAPVDGFAGVDLPAVGDARLHPLASPSQHATLIATRTAVVVEGAEVAPIRDGHLEGDRLGEFLGKLRASPSGGGGLLTVVVDASTPYRLFIELLSAAKPSYRSFQVVARHDAGVGAILLTLPDTATALPPAGTGLAVRLSTTELQIWSTSGTEGTLQQPALTVPTVDPAAARIAMQQKLVEIAGRRPGENRLIVMADGALPMALVAPVMAAAQLGRDGAPLFDDLVLGTGSE